MHDFKSSLAKGVAGEMLLTQYMPELIRLAGRKADFAHATTGELYELKTDSYNMNKTANFFIEIYSDIERGKLGGPAQALEHGSKYWMYLFTQNKILFIFDTKALCGWLIDNAKDYATIEIPNKGWTTGGIKVPREALKHLYTQKELK